VPAGSRTRYNVGGDLEIEIDPWLQRDVSGGDERSTFRSWEATLADDAAGFAAAGPGLLAGRVYIVAPSGIRRSYGRWASSWSPWRRWVGAPLGVVARVRRTAAVAAEARRLQGVTTAVHAEVAVPPLRELWTISSADENLILGYCRSPAGIGNTKASEAIYIYALE
jgi:hypothetical protein